MNYSFQALINLNYYTDFFHFRQLPQKLLDFLEKEGLFPPFVVDTEGAFMIELVGRYMDTFSKGATHEFTRTGCGYHLPESRLF